MKIEIDDKYFNEEELKNTPKRIKKIFEGEMDNGDFEFTTFPTNNYNEMIIWKGSDVSICSHHLMPFIFNIYFAYYPNKKICGLSKIPRLIRSICFKPQLQEKMTVEIVNTFIKQINPQGVMCIINGKHLCCSGRGIRSDGEMITITTRGVFKTNNKLKEEFFMLAKL